MNTKKLSKALNNVKEHGWQVVNLRNCGLTEFPEDLTLFPDLVTIDLGNDTYVDEKNRNKITVIPKSIQKVINLKRLIIDNNEVYEVPLEMASLINLKYLNLANNNLKELPESVANLEGLMELLIDGNPFDIIPPEIVSRGLDSIRNFLTELKEQDFLYEAKLIIVGEGRVGKTCLANALTNSRYELEDQPSTEGINIGRWVIPKNEIEKLNPSIQRDFQINIWDFGGQEIYHSTHQFFLTKRSIYLLVTESRKEDSHDEFIYWLNIIKLLGDNSPVVMVLNKCDQPTKDLPIKEYKSSFENIISFDKISLKAEYKADFLSFKQALIKKTSKLQHIGNPLPKVWVDIRGDIEKLKLEGKNLITLDDYYSICLSHYRRPKGALFLSEYFHEM